MSTFFISYRRDDSSDITGRLYDRLAGHFGRGTIFIDVDTIPFGVDFRSHIESAVGNCDVLLAVIGNIWLGIKDESGQRRLDDSGDFVRIELEWALDRKIPIVPILVGGAKMPKISDLPERLQQLAFFNAAEVRSGREFHSDVDRLIGDLAGHLAGQGKTPPVLEVVPAAVSDDRMECPACKALQDVDREFCTNCGAPLKEPCPVCQAEVTGAQVYCGKCGTGLVEARARLESNARDFRCRAEELLQASQWLRAVPLIEELAAGDHPRVREHTTWANSVLTNARSSADRQRAEIQDRVQRIPMLMEQHQFRDVSKLFGEDERGALPADVLALIDAAAEQESAREHLLAEIFACDFTTVPKEFVTLLQRYHQDFGDDRRLHEAAAEWMVSAESVLKQLGREGRWSAACAVLEAFPSLTRKNVFGELPDKMMACRASHAELQRQLRDLLKEKKHQHAIGVVAEGLKLSPDDTVFRTTGQRLTAALLKTCQRLAEAGEWQKADNFLNGVPEGLRTEEMGSLKSRIEDSLAACERQLSEFREAMTNGRVAEVVKLLDEASTNPELRNAYPAMLLAIFSPVERLAITGVAIQEMKTFLKAFAAGNPARAWNVLASSSKPNRKSRYLKELGDSVVAELRRAGRPLWRQDLLASPVNSQCAWSSSGRYVAVLENASVRLFDTEKRTLLGELAELPGFEKRYLDKHQAMCFERDTDRLLIAYYCHHDKKRRLARYDIAAGETTFHFDWDDDIDCLTASGDGTLIAARVRPRSGNRTLMLWDGQSGEPFLKGLLSSQTIFATDTIFSSSGPRIRSLLLFQRGGKPAMLADYVDDRLGFWRDATKGGRPELVESLKFTTLLAVSSDESCIAAASVDRVRIFRVSPKLQFQGFQLKHEGLITSLVFSPDGSMLLSGGKDGTVRLWDVRTGECRDLRRLTSVLKDAEEQTRSCRDYERSSRINTLLSESPPVYAGFGKMGQEIFVIYRPDAPAAAAPEKIESKKPRNVSEAESDDDLTITLDDTESDFDLALPEDSGLLLDLGDRLDSDSTSMQLELWPLAAFFAGKSPSGPSS